MSVPSSDRKYCCGKWDAGDDPCSNCPNRPSEGGTPTDDDIKAAIYGYEGALAEPEDEPALDKARQHLLDTMKRCRISAPSATAPITPDRFWPMCGSVKAIVKAARGNDLSTELIDELEAEVDAVERELQGGGVFWLIERGGQGQQTMWRTKALTTDLPAWTTNVHEAIQFESKYAAVEWAKGRLSPGTFSVTDHTWLSPIDRKGD